MSRAVILSGVRTPIGRKDGALSDLRPDDLAAIVIAEAVARAGVRAEQIEDVYFGAANQAGEDNRNVARMAVLLAGLPESVAGITVNRLCASGLSAVVSACHAIAAGDGDLFVAGGVESMSRAPLVTAKPEYGDGTTLRHAARLALPKSAHGGEVPARVDGRDRRERRRALADLQGGARRFRSAFAAALGGRSGGRTVRRRARPGERSRARRASTSGHERREACCAETRVPRAAGRSPPAMRVASTTAPPHS